MSPGKDFFTVHNGDARRLGELLKQFSNQNNPQITCTITSPPYGALKDYGHPDQIGWGQPHEDYLVEMRRIFRTLYEHTKEDGSLWLIADSFRSDEPNGGGLPQALVPLPFDLAHQAEDSGWILRDVVIWEKDKTLPWTSGNRLRNSFEYVLLLVKSSTYKFYADRLRDPVDLERWWVKWPERYNPLGKAPTNVWEIPIPVQGSWKTPAVEHACPLPPDLVERLLFLSTDPGDVVFDPFAGTGAVVAEAERLGRLGLGIELNMKYGKAFRSAVRPAVFKRNNDDLLTERMEKAQRLRETILKLRALKYPKVLVQQLAKASAGRLPQPALVVALMGKPKPETLVDPMKLLDVQCLFVVDADADVRENVLRHLKEAASKAPLTKFGIAGDVAVCRLEDIARVVPRKTLHLYQAGRTWDAVRSVRLTDLDVIAAEPIMARRGNYAYPPILANVEVHETPNE